MTVIEKFLAPKPVEDAIQGKTNEKNACLFQEHDDENKNQANSHWFKSVYNSGIFTFQFYFKPKFHHETFNSKLSGAFNQTV